MSDVPAQLKYTATHEWVRLENDGCWAVGITAFAQEALGDLVFVELPPVGEQFAAGEDVAVVESVKAAADVYAPANGEVVAINQAIVDQSGLINHDPYQNWLFKLRPDVGADFDGLLDAATYAATIE